MQQNNQPSLFQVTEINITYHNKVRVADRHIIDSAQRAYDALLASWDINKIGLLEQCKVVMLDRNARCIGISNISTGSITQCLVDPKIVYATALKARSPSIILAHNHPSGNLKPSAPDNAITRKLCAAGKLLDIQFLDHLIISPYGYYSYAENGLIPA